MQDSLPPVTQHDLHIRYLVVVPLRQVPCEASPPQGQSEKPLHGFSLILYFVPLHELHSPSETEPDGIDV